MKRAGFILTVLCLITLMPAAIVAKDCESMSYTDCDGVVTELEQHTASMDFHVLAQWQQDNVRYIYQEGSERLSVLISGLSDPVSTVFQISYRTHGQTVNAQVTASMIASGDYAAVVPVWQAMDADFLTEAAQLSLAIPKSTAQLASLRWMGLASIDCIKESNPAPHPNILGIFYASCYYGCVIGGGGWQACGDTCFDKYGAN